VELVGGLSSADDVEDEGDTDNFPSRNCCTFGELCGDSKLENVGDSGF